MNAELKELIALQNADTAIRRTEAELNAIPQRRAEIEQEFEQRAFEFRAVELKRDEAAATRARLEIEIAEARQQAERSERNLMSSQNEKDYAAAIRESDAVRKHISTLESQTLEQMEMLEASEKELAERAPQVAVLREETNQKLKELDEGARAGEERLMDLRKERERLVASLPKSTTAVYSRISTRIRGGVAVAEARNYSCTACLITLRPQVMSAIRRGDEIVMCENCSRILYYVPSEQTQKATT